MSENITYINAEKYTESVKAAENVIVDFYSTECPPCEALAQKYEPLSQLYGDRVKFYKIFRQENRELAENLDVKSSPTILFYKNGHLAGEKLTGGIRRSEILNNLKFLIGEAEVNKTESSIKKITKEYDLAILGGGPAGLSAAIYAAQAKIKTVLIDQAMPGGQVSTTHQVSNYPGFAEPVNGYMLGHFMAEQAKAAGADFKIAVDITKVDLQQKIIEIDQYETIKARKIILATGASPRLLNIPGEQEFKGKGISYCATCDAKYYEGAQVAVIGGGNSALEEALFISKFAAKVTIIHQFDEFQANKSAQEKVKSNKKIKVIYSHEPRSFEKDSSGMKILIEEIKTKKLSSLSVAGVFIFAGMKPNLEMFNEKFELDSWGYVKTDSDLKSNIPDIYAVGDICSKKYRQITTAVADGTIAAISASKELE